MTRKSGDGLASIYFMHSNNFFGRLRPAYDSAADVQGVLTEKQLRTLRARANKYVATCHRKNIVKLVLSFLTATSLIDGQKQSTVSAIVEGTGLIEIDVHLALEQLKSQGKVNTARPSEIVTVTA